MGSNDNCDLGIQQRDNNTMSSMCLSESSSLGVESFFNTGWNPILSLTQNGELKGSSMASQNHFHNQSSVSPYGVYGNQGVSTSSSHIVHYPSDPRLTDLAPKFQSFGSGNYSEMVGSLTLPDHTQIANGGCLSNNSRNSSSPDGMKRKRPQFNSIQNETAESHKQKDVSEITLNSNEQNEKKSKSKSENANLGGNQTGKQGKDSTSNGQTPKQDYIHMRARRGQATNSHSLAERVRREKISERMKLLQDLVPGCNKITGKAVMLDEIINYVQSLQQQVEFLSMKLATVNPELNFDIEQILSKDILHSRSLGPEILGFAPRMTSFSPANMNLEGSIQPIQCTNPQLPIMSQTPNSWNNELQTMIQMGFIPNQPVDDMGLNGHMKG